jgi:hypothetical protein
VCTHADIEPERHLWAAVIDRAILDLKSSNRRHQVSAKWFFVGRAFDLVADAAGLEPAWIDRMRALAQQGKLQFIHTRYLRVRRDPS